MSTPLKKFEQEELRIYILMRPNDGTNASFVKPAVEYSPSSSIWSLLRNWSASATFMALNSKRDDVYMGVGPHEYK